MKKSRVKGKAVKPVKRRVSVSRGRPATRARTKWPAVRVIPDETLLTVAETARIFRVSRLTLYRRRGKWKQLKVVKVGSHTRRYRRQDVEAFISKCAV